MDAHAHEYARSPVLEAETLAYGAVHLDVTDAERAVGFWYDVVGLSVLERSAQEVRLGVEGRELVVLHPGAERGSLRGHSGLYHLALHLPDEKELARVLWRLTVANYPHAPTDHTMSKSTYLRDPDGLSLELVLETPERLGSWSNDDGELRLIDAEGNAHGMAEPLDVNDVFGHLPNRDFLQPPLPAGTTVGHLHLHVSDLDRALHFYRDLIGFREHMYAPELGFSDLGAGGRFPHRLALNTWQGAGAPQPSPGSAGLRRFELVFPDADALADTLWRLEAAGHASEPVEGGVLVRDPAGNRILLATGR
jgi:catechol 2,3-dioxygenase